MSDDVPMADQPPLSAAEIAKLAEEMHTAGFPEIAEVLIGLAYQLAENSNAEAVSARVLDKDCPPEARSGWMRA